MRTGVDILFKSSILAIPEINPLSNKLPPFSRKNCPMPKTCIPLIAWKFTLGYCLPRPQSLY